MHLYLTILLQLLYVISFVLVCMGIIMLPGWAMMRKGISDTVCFVTMLVLGFILMPGAILLLINIGNRLFPGVDS